MRITYLHQYYNNPKMAGSQRSYNISQSLSKEGHEVTVITSSTDGKNKKRCITYDGNVKIVWIPVKYSNSFSFFRRIIAFLIFMSRASIEVLTHKSDLVYATSTPLTIAIPALIKKLLHKTNFIFEVRDLWPELPIAMGALKAKWQIWLANILEKLVYKQASCIIALSTGMRDGILKKGIDLKKIAVVPNFSDISQFDKIDMLKKLTNKKIIYAGALGHINNIDWICNFSESLYLYDKEIVLEVYGDGIKNKILEEYSNSTSNNLIFNKPISKSDIFQKFSESSFSIISFNDIPEMQNNSSNKFFDSLASSTPVIINFGGWINKLVEDHDIGLSAWKKDIDVFAKEVAMSFKNDKKYILFSENSFYMAKNNFSVEIGCKKIKNIIDQVLKGNCNINHIATGEFND